MRAHMNCVLTPGDSVNSDGDHKDIKGHGGVFTPIYIAVDRKTEWEISISAGRRRAKQARRLSQHAVPRARARGRGGGGGGGAPVRACGRRPSDRVRRRPEPERDVIM